MKCQTHLKANTCHIYFALWQIYDGNWLHNFKVNFVLLHYMDKHTGPPTHYSYRKCLALETHVTKLLVHSFHADRNGRGGLELCSY